MKMNNKVMGLILAGVILVGVVSCSSNVQEDTTDNKQTQVEKQENTTENNGQTQVENKTEEKVEEAITFEDPMLVNAKDYDIKIKSVEAQNGNLKLVYDFTNNKTETAQPFTSVSFKIFQDGVSLEQVYDLSIDYGIGQKSIMGGFTIENCEDGVVLAGDSLVQIFVSDWISFNDECYAEFTFNPQTGELIRVQ